MKPSAAFRVECIDRTGGQIGNNDRADDVWDAGLNQVYYLSGPSAVDGAGAGDLLVVDILDIGALPTSPWGFTGIFAKTNGGGFLTDFYPDAKKAIWDFHGIYAVSRHIHGVKFAGLTHPGLIGCAPSADCWPSGTGVKPSSSPPTPPAYHPWPTCRSPAGAPGADQARQRGGNCDIKNLSRGSRVYFPVYARGDNLSMGDIHSSQGDGEISFCGAIEMAG